MTTSNKFTEFYDQEFQKLDHYHKFPLMMPFVGSHFQQQKKKVLFIGESHYLPLEYSLHSNAYEWYNNYSQNDIIPTVKNKDVLCWIYTRFGPNSGNNQKYYSRAYSIYRNIDKSILDVFKPDLTDNMFRYVSYYNYFQRPAEAKLSIENNKIDNEFAIEIFNQLHQIIQFEYVIFASKRAFNAFKSEQNSLKAKISLDNVFSVPHPGSKWFNKINNSCQIDGVPHNGKDYLKHILLSNKIFE